MKTSQRYGGPGEPKLGDVLWARQMAEKRRRKAEWHRLSEAGQVCEHELCFERRGVNGRWCLWHYQTDGMWRHSGNLRLVLPQLGVTRRLNW